MWFSVCPSTHPISDSAKPSGGGDAFKEDLLQKTCKCSIGHENAATTARNKEAKLCVTGSQKQGVGCCADCD